MTSGELDGGTVPLFDWTEGLSRRSIREMYLEHLSMGQIARMTGVSKSTVHLYIKEMDSREMMERKSFRLREEGEAWNMGDDEVW